MFAPYLRMGYGWDTGGFRLRVRCSYGLDYGSVTGRYYGWVVTDWITDRLRMIDLSQYGWCIRNYG